jgi:hypothetical protein
MVSSIGSISSQSFIGLKNLDNEFTSSKKIAMKLIEMGRTSFSQISAHSLVDRRGLTGENRRGNTYGVGQLFDVYV